MMFPNESFEREFFQIRRKEAKMEELKNKSFGFLLRNILNTKILFSKNRTQENNSLSTFFIYKTFASWVTLFSGIMKR